MMVQPRMSMLKQATHVRKRSMAATRINAYERSHKRNVSMAAQTARRSGGLSTTLTGDSFTKTFSTRTFRRKKF
jgi:hypothetical protein